MGKSKNSKTCLLCDKKTQLRRGLCSSHYQKFIRAWRSVPEQHRSEFELELIEEGLLLPAQTRGRKSEDMIFKEKAAKYLVKDSEGQGNKPRKRSKTTKKSSKKKPRKKNKP